MINFNFYLFVLLCFFFTLFLRHKVARETLLVCDKTKVDKNCSANFDLYKKNTKD